MSNETNMPRVLPRLNEPAPIFDALTTLGRKTLEDYRGQWLVLFSHPADFTPVCTTEFMGFGRRYSDFRAIGCELLGLSVDSQYSHVAWVREIERKFEVEIGFPIIADRSMEVARAYGMIQPGASDTSTVRATFVIDPEGVLRAMFYYPMENGRSSGEILRLVKAMQTSDAFGVATPENWQPGDQVIARPPESLAEAAARMADTEYDCVDWYFCRRPL